MSPSPRTVTIHGMGAISALGPDMASLWEGLVSGRSGVAASRRFVVDGARRPAVAEVDEAWVGETLARVSSRNAALCDIAVTEALAGEAGDALDVVAPEGRGLYTAIRRDDESDGPGGGSGAGGAQYVRRLADRLELHGPRALVHDACATGAALVEMACDDLRGGHIDAAVVAAANADLSLETLAHYELLGALSHGDAPDACRPFDARRDGFVRGEAAAALLLRAHDGPAPPGFVRVAGVASSADGHELTSGHPEQLGLKRVLRAVLGDAGLPAENVGLIDAHGTGTPVGDRNEALALAAVFGAPGPPVTAIKGRTGHASFASGLLELIATALSLRHRVAVPAARDFRADPELPDLDVVVGQPRPIDAGCALSLSSAFGGFNGAVLLVL